MFSPGNLYSGIQFGINKMKTCLLILGILWFPASLSRHNSLLVAFCFQAKVLLGILPHQTANCFSHIHTWCSSPGVNTISSSATMTTLLSAPRLDSNAMKLHPVLRTQTTEIASALCPGRLETSQLSRSPIYVFCGGTQSASVELAVRAGSAGLHSHTSFEQQGPVPDTV